MSKLLIPSIIALLLQCTLLLLCISHNGFVSALSSPSRMNGYNLRTSTSSFTTPKKLKASDLNKQPRQQKSYVPDGLTEEQYRKIKNQELAKQQAMNFGMWGPRFKQTDGDPEFWNWFSSPTLWTGGFYSNGRSKDVENGSGDGRKIGIANLLLLYLRRYGLAYIIMLISTQILVKSLLPVKKIWTTKVWVLASRILLPIVTLKPLEMVASFAEKREKNYGITKLATVLAVLISSVSLVALR